jgi:hypothetical protein
MGHPVQCHQHVVNELNRHLFFEFPFHIVPESITGALRSLLSFLKEIKQAYSVAILSVRSCVSLFPLKFLDQITNVYETCMNVVPLESISDTCFINILQSLLTIRRRRKKFWCGSCNSAMKNNSDMVSFALGLIVSTNEPLMLGIQKLVTG